VLTLFELFPSARSLAFFREHSLLPLDLERGALRIPCALPMVDSSASSLYFDALCPFQQDTFSGVPRFFGLVLKQYSFRSFPNTVHRVLPPPYLNRFFPTLPGDSSVYFLFVFLLFLCHLKIPVYVSPPLINLFLSPTIIGLVLPPAGVFTFYNS